MAHNQEQVDTELYGLLKLRSALCGRELDETLTLSPELRSFAEWMDALDLERVRDFCQALREQARMLGTALPIIAQEGFPPSSR